MQVESQAAAWHLPRSDSCDNSAQDQGREDQRRSRVLRASFAVMGNAHVIGCVLPLGRAIKLRYAFNHSAAIVLYLRTGSSTAAAISSDFAAVCTEEAEPARSNSSAIANNAGDSQKARCLEFYFDWLTGSQSKTCVEGHADAAHRAQSSSGYLFRCGPPREPGGQPGIAANDACSHL